MDIHLCIFNKWILRHGHHMDTSTRLRGVYGDVQNITPCGLSEIKALPTIYQSKVFLRIQRFVKFSLVL